MKGKDYDKAFSALKKCRKLIDEVMPQIGKLSIQDYKNLNEALMESSNVLNNKKINEAGETNCFYYYTCPKIMTCAGCRSFVLVKNEKYNKLD